MISILPLGILIFIAVIVFFGDEIHFWVLSLFAKRKLNKLGYKLDDLNFSFEQIVYLVSTPSSNYRLSELDCKYEMEKLRVSPFFPKIDLLKIIAHLPSDERINLALIKKEKFPVPILDALLFHNKITKREYNILVSYLFAHPRTHELILEEIRTRVTQG